VIDTEYKPATVAEVRQKILDRIRNEWGVEEIDTLVRAYVALGAAAPLPKTKRK